MPSWKIIGRALAVRGPISFGTSGPVLISGAGFPASGTAGAGAGHAPPGSIYTDVTRGTTWQNEGTEASPYWSPTSYDQAGMIAINAPDFAASDEVLIASTATSVELAPSGWTALGDGIHETDSGAERQAAAEGIMPTIRLITSNAAGDLVGLCTPVVGSAGIYQPDTNGMAIMEADITNVSAITTRIVYVGFSGLAPVGLTDVVTAATTVTTNVENDLAGLYMASTATDADRIIAAKNAAGADATSDYSVLTDLNTGVNMAAAATVQRLRVEVDGDGGIRMFIDKVLVYTAPAASLAVNQELNAVVYISPTTTTIVNLDVLRASFVMGRAA